MASFFGLCSFSFKNAKRVSIRAELTGVVGPRWEVGGGSQFGGVGGVEMARQQQPGTVGFVRPTGEGGED